MKKFLFLVVTACLFNIIMPVSVMALGTSATGAEQKYTREQLQQKRKVRVEELKKCLQEDKAGREEYQKRAKENNLSYSEAVKKARAEFKLASGLAQDTFRSEANRAKDKREAELKAISDKTIRQTVIGAYRGAYAQILEARKLNLKTAKENLDTALRAAKDAKGQAAEKLKSDRDELLKKAHQPCVLGTRIEGMPWVMGEWWTWGPLTSKAFSLEDADSLKNKETNERGKLQAEITGEELRLKMEERRARQEQLRKCRTGIAQVYRDLVASTEKAYKDGIGEAFKRLEIDIKVSNNDQGAIKTIRDKHTENRKLLQADRREGLKVARDNRTAALKQCAENVTTSGS